VTSPQGAAPPAENHAIPLLIRNPLTGQAAGEGPCRRGLPWAAQRVAPRTSANGRPVSDAEGGAAGGESGDARLGRPHPPSRSRRNPTAVCPPPVPAPHLVASQPMVLPAWCTRPALGPSSGGSARCGSTSGVECTPDARGSSDDTRPERSPAHRPNPPGLEPPPGEPDRRWPPRAGATLGELAAPQTQGVEGQTSAPA
jgi:hypothetical protein